MWDENCNGKQVVASKKLATMNKLATAKKPATVNKLVTAKKLATANKPATTNKPATANKPAAVGLAGTKRKAPQEEDKGSDHAAVVTGRRNVPRRVKKMLINN